MAIYHFSAQILSRKPRQNPDGSWRPASKAVAAAAYRSGERLEDHHHKESHDYERRRGVAYTEVMIPPGSAPWLESRELLWNRVEAMEERRDAQLCREFNMALPFELEHEDRVELVRNFVAIQFVSRGMVADIALHDPIREEGQNEKNFHAHVMLTLRRATPSGLDPVKTREWNSKALLKLWRVEWEIACNRALARANKRERVDHRTLAAQREEAIREGDRERAAELRRRPEIHVGPRARQILGNDRVPTSKVREANAYRRVDPKASKPTKRRQINYPYFDRTTRLNWLERILSNNSEQYRRAKEKIDQRCDRLNRKIDYWQRRQVFLIDGAMGGKRFRFERWKRAQTDKERRAERERKVAHARRRLDQLQKLLKITEGLLQVTGKRRELCLVRRREVEGWVRAIKSRGRPPGRSKGRWRWRGEGRT